MGVVILGWSRVSMYIANEWLTFKDIPLFFYIAICMCRLNHPYLITTVQNGFWVV